MRTGYVSRKGRENEDFSEKRLPTCGLYPVSQVGRRTGKCEKTKVRNRFLNR